MSKLLLIGTIPYLHHCELGSRVIIYLVRGLDSLLRLNYHPESTIPDILAHSHFRMIFSCALYCRDDYTSIYQ